MFLVSQLGGSETKEESSEVASGIPIVCFVAARNKCLEVVGEGWDASKCGERGVLIVFTDEELKCISAVEELTIKLVTSILAALQLGIIVPSCNGISLNM